MVDDNFEDDDGPLDPQLVRVGQLEMLREKYARLWRANGNLDHIHELERLLELLLASPGPIELPAWAQALTLDELPSQIRRALEQLTCKRLIDPMLKARGWTGDLVRREAHFRDKRDGRSKRVDYALWLPRNNGRRRLIAFIEAKHEGRRPDHGLEQVKAYAAGRRERIPFVFSTNGRRYVQYNRRTKIQSGSSLLEDFPTPDDLAALLLVKT